MTSDTPLQEMFMDTYNRYYESVGHPPELMLANVNFRRDLCREISVIDPFVFFLKSDPVKEIPHYRIFYRGVPIDCVIDSVRATLVAADWLCEK